MPRPHIRFVILAAPRTGSNLLCTLLNTHPDVLCHHGLFNPGGIHYALDRRDGALDLGTVEERDRSPLVFLEKVWRYNAGKRAIGFKLNLGENESATAAALHDPQICKILLRRGNRIKTYVSERIAERTGLWESYAGAATSPSSPIQVDAEELLAHAARNRTYYAGLEAHLRATGQTWLAAEYESLAPELPNGDVARILAFLGVHPRTGLIAGSFKRNPDDLRVLIANYEELHAELEGTEWESELHQEQQSCLI